MRLLPLDRLGARETSPGVVEFGVLLPGVSSANGLKISARIIHEDDQFLQQVPPVDVPLAHSTLDGLGDYWSGSVNIPATPGPTEARGWGQQRRYVYRFIVRRPGQADIDGIIDPFAREFGVGNLSAITLGYEPFEFDPATENAFKAPSIQKAIVYELNIAELGGDLNKTIHLLSYLEDLGVNVIEVMPVSNVAARVDWGYAPLGYFGVDERHGKRKDFQRFVAEAHRRKIAVVLDSVYGHVEDRFPYALLYERLGLPSPFVGPFARDLFFKSTDFARSFVQDFFFTVNVHWLEVFHVDGFRYDAVSQYWDEGRSVGQQGFVDLAQATRDHVAARTSTAKYERFLPAGDGEITLIQIAEFLDSSNPPEHVLFDTVSNSAWQNQTMDAAKKCARGEAGALAELGLRLGLVNYPESRDHAGVTVTKSALQYIENHDHERFICTYGTHFPDQDSEARRDELLLLGNRDEKWFKVQPYLIGLMTAKGTPLLWQGQEFGQNYFVPDRGTGRVAIYRPVDFNLFYDPVGKILVNLVRQLTRIRHNGAQFTEGEHFFYNDFGPFVSQGLLVFHRRLGNTFSLVALNFTDEEKTSQFRFPVSGECVEEIEGKRNLGHVTAGDATQISIPSNFGCLWTIRP